MKTTANKQSQTLRLWIAAMTMPWLVACGGGGSGGDAVSSSLSSAQVDETPVVDEERQIDGGAIKGVIRNGIVTAYAVESLAGRYVQSSKVVGRTTRTNDKGSFRLSIPRHYAGAMVVEISADSTTRMRCDVVAGCEVNSTGTAVAFGQEFPLTASFKLRGAIDTDTQNRVYVTPISHLAVAQAAARTDGLTVTNLSATYRLMEQSFGLTENTLNTAPSDLTRLTESDSATAIKLGVLNAAFLALVAEPTWGDISDVLADASARIVSSGSLPAVSASDDISLESLLYAAQDLAVDLKSTTTSTALKASMDVVAAETASTYTEVVGNSTVGGGTEVVSVPPTTTPPTTTTPPSTTPPTTPVEPVTPPAPVVRNATLAWTAPLTRENGESLAMSDIAGYVIVYGTTAGNLEREVEINSAYTTQYQISNLDAGQWYFAVRSVDATGQQSRLSGVVTKTL